MSKQKGKVVNVRREYRQSYLSGYEHLSQPTNQNGNSKTVKRTDETPQIRKGQKCYSLSVEIIIEQISDDSSEYNYRILLNDDPNISIVPYSVRSKKKIGQDVNLPKKGIKGGDAFSLVYGVHKSGKCSLSHTSQHPLQRVLPQIYSFILGSIDRAIECTILIPENETGNDDPRQRIESTLPQKSVGTNKKARRSKTLRAEILPETLPEKAADVVEADRQILGERQADRQVGPIDLGSRTDNRESIADALSSGRTPDLGF